MDLLNKIEHKFGRFAIPGLLRVIGGFQFLVWVLLRFVSIDFAEMLEFNPQRILQGEVWRLISYVFLPRTLSFWIFIQVMFLWFINDGLESVWGSFRLNLYFFGSMLALTVGCFLLPAVPTGEFLYYSVFLAFAVIYPDQIIQFMLVLPIKIKYLGYVLGGYLALLFFRDYRLAITITFSLIPFACFALPKAIQFLIYRSQVAERRHRYAQHSIPAGEAFHHCASCGKTEEDDPGLEFRVTADGEELCVPCLEKRRLGDTNAAPEKAAGPEND